MKAYLFSTEESYGDEGDAVVVIAENWESAREMAYLSIGGKIFYYKQEEAECIPGLIIRAESYYSPFLGCSTLSVPDKITYLDAQKKWKDERITAWDDIIRGIECEIEKYKAVGGPKMEKRLRKLDERLQDAKKTREFYFS